MLRFPGEFRQGHGVYRGSAFALDKETYGDTGTNRACFHLHIETILAPSPPGYRLTANLESQPRENFFKEFSGSLFKPVSDMFRGGHGDSIIDFVKIVYPFADLEFPIKFVSDGSGPFY